MCKKLLTGKMIGALAVILVLFMAAGVAEEERTDAGGATITGMWRNRSASW